MRICIVQYGNYRDAYLALQHGGAETYRDQKTSVDLVASLATDHHVATVALRQPAHETELADGLISIGAPQAIADSRSAMLVAVGSAGA